MLTQLSLFEIPKPRAPKYCLFLAVFPDSRTAQSIINLGNAFRQNYELRGKLRPQTHLHVSLYHIGNTNHVSDKLVEVVSRVCKPVASICRPFEISFDRVFSFRGTSVNHPLVLAHEDSGNDGVKNLQKSIHAEFAKYTGSGGRISKIKPHVTLLYDKQEIDAKHIEPVHWTVKEIVLIRSEVGATKYHRLGNWILEDSGLRDNAALPL
jgi:2'-5' RNA ligase